MAAQQIALLALACPLLDIKLADLELAVKVLEPCAKGQGCLSYKPRQAHLIMLAYGMLSN